MTSSAVGPRSSSKALPKAKLAPKNRVMATVWRSAVGLIHYHFLIPGETITSENYAQQIDEMPWKLQRLQPALFNWMGPILHDNAQPYVAQPMLQKLNKLGYEVLPHLPYSPDLSPTDATSSSISTTLREGKTLPQPAEGRKCFPRVCKILRLGFLCYRNKQTYFSLAKMCWL